MTIEPSPESVPAAAEEWVEVPPRSPRRAACYAALLPGAGQVYNKQLEKAVLLWIWGAILLGAGLLLLLLGALGRWVPGSWTRPPLGDWVADHAGAVFLLWLLAAAALWGFAVRDALLTARSINEGEVRIRYPMRRQMVHVLASQLLGFIPLIGLLFPPGIVAEAIDVVKDRRGPDHRRVLREGGQALVEWALTRLAFYALWLFAALWLLWWLLRAFGLAP
jgi:hypothetical protein